MKQIVILLSVLLGIFSSAYTQESSFAYPTLPDSLKTVEQRASYLTLHYWDNFNFTDTLQLNDTNNAEQGFVNYIDLLARLMQLSIKQTDRAQELHFAEVVKESVHIFSNNAFKHPSAKNKFENLIDHYLKNPKSPMRNDKTFLLFLQEMKTSPFFDETEKERINFQIKTRNKNLPGDKAVDIAFSDKEGNTHHLRDYQNKKIILYFYDPDCDNCHKVSAWFDKQTIPAEYTFLPIHADAHISDTYSLEAMPTIYLLNKGNIVVLKDCSPEVLMQVIK